MTDYKQIEGGAWLKFGDALLYEKDSPVKQREFLCACLDGNEAFLRYVGDILPEKDTVVGKEEFVFDYKFTEQEFCNPPESTQEIIWNAFHKCDPETLSSCGFWAYTVRRLLETDRIESTFLASGENSSSVGNILIREALAAEDNLKKVDVCARRILRSMCNSSPRGNRVLFSDFHLGRTYWRWYWAKHLSEIISLEPEKIRNVLNLNHYKAFAENIHSGKSCVATDNVFGGLVLYLQAEEEKLSGEKLGDIINRISYLSAWKAIEAQSPEDNQNEIANIA